MFPSSTKSSPAKKSPRHFEYAPFPLQFSKPSLVIFLAFLLCATRITKAPAQLVLLLLLLLQKTIAVQKELRRRNGNSTCSLIKVAGWCLTVAFNTNAQWSYVLW